MPRCGLAATTAGARISKLVVDNNNPNLAYSSFDLGGIIDELARDVAATESRSTNGGGDYYTGTVSVSGDG